MRLIGSAMTLILILTTTTCAAWQSDYQCKKTCYLHHNHNGYLPCPDICYKKLSFIYRQVDYACVDFCIDYTHPLAYCMHVCTNN